MRTIGEHISGIAKCVSQQFRRLARAAMACVRTVLKRVQGGVRHRHVEEASDCAPAITACCHTGEAVNLIGLPEERPAITVCAVTHTAPSAGGQRVLFLQNEVGAFAGPFAKRFGQAPSRLPVSCISLSAKG